MDRYERPPDSTLILIASLVQLLATMATSFMHGYDFLTENIDAINDNQLDLFNRHLTHILCYFSLLWCLLLGILRMCIRTFSCRTTPPVLAYQVTKHQSICVTLFVPKAVAGAGAPFLVRPICVTLFCLGDRPRRSAVLARAICVTLFEPRRCAGAGTPSI